MLSIISTCLKVAQWQLSALLVKQWELEAWWPPPEGWYVDCCNCKRFSHGHTMGTWYGIGGGDPCIPLKAAQWRKAKTVDLQGIKLLWSFALWGQWQWVWPSANTNNTNTKATNTKALFKTKLQSALHGWTRIKTFQDCLRIWGCILAHKGVAIQQSSWGL